MGNLDIDGALIDRSPQCIISTGSVDWVMCRMFAPRKKPFIVRVVLFFVPFPVMAKARWKKAKAAGNVRASTDPEAAIQAGVN